MQVYKHSGAVPVMGAVMALMAGALTSLGLGVAYSFTFYYIPFVYLNFVAAMAFGAGTGYVVGLCAREGKIRNVVAVGSLAAVAAIAGIYAEWGSTVYAMSPTEELSQLWTEAGIYTFHPLAIQNLMLGLFGEGSWGVIANANITGWPLVALWIIEAGLVVGLSVKTAVDQIAERPFCERCQLWVSGHAPHRYEGNGSEPVWTDVQNGTFETLALTARATGEEPAFVCLTLKSCESCSESNFVTISACKNTTDDKGNPKLETVNLVTNLVMQSTQVEIIEAANIIAPAPGESPLRLPPDVSIGMFPDALQLKQVVAK
jgi:hypothetical protein